MTNDLLQPASAVNCLCVVEDITVAWGHYHLVDADRSQEALCGARTTGKCLNIDWGEEAVRLAACARETFCVKCDWVAAFESGYSKAEPPLDTAAMREVHQLFEEFDDDQ